MSKLKRSHANAAHEICRLDQAPRALAIEKLTRCTSQRGDYASSSDFTNRVLIHIRHIDISIGVYRNTIEGKKARISTSGICGTTLTRCTSKRCHNGVRAYRRSRRATTSTGCNECD
jgi:hypothetical protein